jgi:hypothetical protein
MDAISPVYLLLGAVICSMVGRFMLIRAAWEISKGWGVAVLCLPLAPLVFRMKYKELAGEGRNWLRGAAAFGVGFMALTGSNGSLGDLWSIVPERFRPAEYAEHHSADSEELVPEPADDGKDEDTEAANTESDAAPAAATKLSPKAAPAEKKSFFGRIATLLHRESSEPAPVPIAAPASVPAGPTLAERVATNQAEFARLGQVYEGLKKERGYLKKWDQDAIKAYNEEAAKYQADLAKARADQMEINKQAAVAKK